MTHRKIEDKTCLSYWFPKIEAAGLPVPKTEILTVPEEAAMAIWKIFDGEPVSEKAQPFFNAIKAAAARMGYPCFLRTGQTSGKHDWKNTCFLEFGGDIPNHVFSLVDFSECADLMGLNWYYWVVREYLPIKPFAVCSRYSDMPVCREFRFFVEDEKIICRHPYWPEHAIKQGGADISDEIYQALCRIENQGELDKIASAAGRAVGGAWSVDLLETERGWYLTDMAETHKSWHWEDFKIESPHKNTQSSKGLNA